MAVKKATPAKQKPLVKKAQQAKKPAPVKEDKDSKKVYHLTKRKEDGMWAITFVGGTKAVKLFKTNVGLGFDSPNGSSFAISSHKDTSISLIDPSVMAIAE